jgi:hypothetical protein
VLEDERLLWYKRDNITASSCLDTIYVVCVFDPKRQRFAVLVLKARIFAATQKH